MIEDNTSGSSIQKPKLLLLGKLPPPYFGPAVATQILLRSKLVTYYDVIHVNTNVHNDLNTLGVWDIRKVVKNVGIYIKFVKVLRKDRPDVVIVPISQATIGFLKDSMFILLSKLFGRKTVVQLRGSNLQNWLAREPAPTRAYIDAVIRTAHGAIVLGAKLRPLFEKYFAVERIFVVPNGADYDVPSRVEESSGPVKILWLANLMRSKGIEDVLEAAHLLHQSCALPFRVDVFGAWRDEQTRKRCNELMKKYQPPVTIHPPISGEEKMRRLAEADTFVFPPREPEGHPWVIVEALAAGLPIVSTDQGVITESVMDGINGFIVESRNPAQLADKLGLLIQQPELRKRFGQVSRDHYLKNFREENMVSRLRYAVDSVLAA